MKKEYKIIAFDADDTLWVNEPYYRETEIRLYELLADFGKAKELEETLYNIETGNLSLYGYGAKGHTLSMIETAFKVSNNKVSSKTIKAIIDNGKELINKPVVLLDGVVEVLQTLYEKGFKLIVVTKGDLLDQQRKLSNSGLLRYFHHIEIVSDKKEADYKALLKKLAIEPMDFLMIGNSRKSDIIPVVNIGGHAIFVPYHTSWQHEEAPKTESKNCIEVENIKQIPLLLNI